MVTSSWLIVFLVVGNIRRLVSHNPVIYFIRMTGYFAVYLVPFAIDRFTIPILKNTRSFWIALSFAIVLGVVILWKDYERTKKFNFDMLVASMTYKTKYAIVLGIYNVIGAAVCEEIYFRGYLLSGNQVWFVKIMFSVGLFMLSHYLLQWSDAFVLKDYLRQIIIGLINAIMFLYCESIIPCICLHMFCNGNSIILACKRFERYYINPKKYDCIMNEDSEIDIDF